MKRLLLIFLFPFFINYTFAQVGEPRTDFAIGGSGGFVMNQVSEICV